MTAERTATARAARRDLIPETPYRLNSRRELAFLPRPAEPSAFLAVGRLAHRGVEGRLASEQPVALPQGADPAQIDCDYPEDVLFKAASAQLETKAPDVLAFLESFTITTDDQLSMLPAVEIDGEEASEVAARWVTENQSVWEAWLP